MKLTIRYKLTAPLSHIGETASTGSYFQTVLTSAGKIPVVTANSVRGQLRDCGAKFLLDTWGIKVDKDVFHTLFSGGNISGTMKNDIGKAQKVREVFPLVSLFGGGLGDIIMAGKLNLTFAYPVCWESQEITNIKSDISWHNLIDEIEHTRTDDSKNDKLVKYISNPDAAKKEGTASTQMRYGVQYLAAGTELWQKLSLINANDLETGTLLNAFKVWFECPTLGGMASKGFGYFDAEINGGEMSVIGGRIKISDGWASLIANYQSYLQTVDYEPYLGLLKGAAKAKETSKSKAPGKEFLSLQKKYPEMDNEIFEDCLTMQKTLEANEIYKSLEDIYQIWSIYSEQEFSASWMNTDFNKIESIKYAFRDNSNAEE